MQLLFLGINMFWALLTAHFNPRPTARAKMSVSRAQNIIMPANSNCIIIIITQEGTEKIKTEKKNNKKITTQSEEYFFNQRCKKTTTNTVMDSRFWLAAHVVGLFDSHFS